MQKRQAYGDKADDHNSDSAKEGPPKIVVGVLLLEPLSFSFITRPTKRCLRIVTATLERAPAGETRALRTEGGARRSGDAFETPQGIC
jgi:hypothetical protein